MQITIDRTADWWLGQLDDEWFHALEKSVRDEWGVQPLQIREGGVRLIYGQSSPTLLLTLIS